METKSDKIQQFRTASGLTPIQEQAAILMASGERITAIAERLQVNRCTIYEWMNVLTFQCFYNKQCKIIKEKLWAGLLGLQKETIEAMKGSLQSDNPAIKLKAAIWMAERLIDGYVGETDPIEIIKDRCRHGWGNNDEEFKKLLEEYHLPEQGMYEIKYNDLPREMPLTPTEKALLGIE